MQHTIRQIATALGADAAGDLDLTIDGAAEPAMAVAGDLALALSPAYAEGLVRGCAQAALLWPGADWRAFGLKAAIFVPRGRLAMAGLSRILDTGPAIADGVHGSCVVDASAQIGHGAAIGPFVTIGAGVRIGARARIAAHVSIGEGAAIGQIARLDECGRLVLVRHFAAEILNRPRGRGSGWSPESAMPPVTFLE